MDDFKAIDSAGGKGFIRPGAHNTGCIEEGLNPPTNLFHQEIQKELLATENRFRQMIDVIPETIYEMDTTGRVLFLNRAGFEKFSVTDEDLQRGFWPHKLLIPEDRERAETEIRRGGAGEFVGPKEFSAAARDGRVIRMMVHAIPIFREGRVVGLQVLLVDITERKNAEEKLQKAHEGLEARVRESTLEIEKTNAALNILLRKCEEERRVIEARVMFNAKSLILPYVEKLKHRSMPEHLRSVVRVIEENLNNFVSPFASRLAYQFVGFTPTEIQVANLIRQDRSTKEIAQLLGLSPRTIENHRKHIRTKIGLRNKKANLRSYLLSIESA
jgi:PAS domain S-box-containing protein